MKVVFIGIAAWLLSLTTAISNVNSLTLLIGTYTGGSSEGIYVYRFDLSTFEPKWASTTKMNNPSYLAVSNDASKVYAVSEGDDQHSAVYGFKFDKTAGRLLAINQAKVGSGPCFIYLNETNRFLVTANYGGGSVSVVPLKKNGELAECTETYIFANKGVDPVRQKQSHMHCIATTPDRRSLYATDLGGDAIYSFDILPPDMERKVSFLQKNENETVNLQSGSGPRHLIFNSIGTRGYLINELSGQVSVFKISEKWDTKTMHEVQSILADTCFASGSADIHLSPDERFLYVSTRLQGDGIVIFQVQEDGTLVKTGYQPTGRHPRHFTISPDGNLLFVACKDSGYVQIFRINQQTGQLTDTEKQIQLDQPVFVYCL